MQGGFGRNPMVVADSDMVDKLGSIVGISDTEALDSDWHGYTAWVYSKLVGAVDAVAGDALRMTTTPGEVTADISIPGDAVAAVSAGVCPLSVSTGEYFYAQVKGYCFKLNHSALAPGEYFTMNTGDDNSVFVMADGTEEQVVGHCMSTGETYAAGMLYIPGN